MHTSPKQSSCCSAHQHHHQSGTSLLVLTAFAFVLSIPFALHMAGLSLPLFVQICLATTIQFGAGYIFYLGAWRELRSLSLHMDTLVALGTTAAYGLSLWNSAIGGHLYFETSAFLIFFVLFGRFLETRAKRHAGEGMKALLRLQPKEATLKVDGEYLQVPIEKIPTQAIVVIKPGERIPVDGTVVSGESLVNEALLTGESVPVSKQPSSSVFAGTVNQQGLLEVKAIHVGPETVLGHIAHLVEQAQSSKAPIERIADQVTAYFVPAVLTIALLTLLLWGFITHDFAKALINAVAVLVIACPCALGLATPIAIIVACGKGASQGILIKDAAVLEKAQNIQLIILDKTGTVTEGKLKVTEAVSLHDNFHSIAATLARHSSHPASQVIVDRLSNVKPLDITHYASHPGRGVGGKIGPEEYYLGSPQLMKTLGIDISALEKSWNQESGMIVVCADSKQCLGYFVLEDNLRSEAVQVVEKLHQRKISVFLLSGARKEKTARIAEALHVDGFKAEVFPDQKATVVHQFKQENRIVAMVGDGINDAPALAAADIGFAIGAGADVALESASVILMNSNLNGVVDTLDLAQRTFATIRQNLIFAFGYNILGIPFAALGFLHPVIAGIAMALSSISVVTNSLLLARK